MLVNVHICVCSLSVNNYSFLENIRMTIVLAIADRICKHMRALTTSDIYSEFLRVILCSFSVDCFLSKNVCFHIYKNDCFFHIHSR